MFSPELSLPYQTSSWPGVGGCIKQSPEDFQVREHLLYQPTGEGDHVFCDLERAGMETRSMLSLLSEVTGVPQKDLGYAGLKDKQALSRQWISVPWPGKSLEDLEALLMSRSEWAVHQCVRYGNKLKRGHNLGNSFRIVVRQVRGCEDTLAGIAGHIVEHGLANFFGPQRFGRDGLNAHIGRAVLKGRYIRSRTQRGLMLNAWQSELFNRWLVMRLERTGLDRLLCGDIARVEGRGGLFRVEDAAADTGRCQRGELQLTGPMFGAKMMTASGEPGRWEEELLAAEELEREALKRQRLPGTRRAARIRAGELHWELRADNLLLSFFLPKGSYATIVTREFVKNSP